MMDYHEESRLANLAQQLESAIERAMDGGLSPDKIRDTFAGAMDAIVEATR